MLIIAVALALVFAACGGDDAASTTMVAAEDADFQDRAALEPEAGVAGGFEVGEFDGTTVNLPADLKIIRQADLQIRVSEGEFDAAWARMRVIAADAGGYLSNASLGIDERYGGERYAYGTVTLRVPVDRFDAVLDRLEGVGERIGLSVNSTDVSEEYFDLEARLRHWKSTEAFYLRLMEEAVTVGELVTVQSELERTQLEIERIEGRQRYLDDRTSFSTITVGITEAPDDLLPPDDDEPGRFAKIWNDAIDVMIEGFGFILVAAAGLLPFAALAALALLIWSMVRRSRRPTVAGEEDPTVAGEEDPTVAGEEDPTVAGEEEETDEDGTDPDVTVEIE